MHLVGPLKGGDSNSFEFHLDKTGIYSQILDSHHVHVNLTFATSILQNFTHVDIKDNINHKISLITWRLERVKDV